MVARLELPRNMFAVGLGQASEGGAGEDAVSGLAVSQASQ